MNPLKRNVTPQSLLLNAWDFVTATQNAVKAPSWCQAEGSCERKKKELFSPLERSCSQITVGGEGGRFCSVT
jgi:dissimilatory sulfite reductase (desulfoviridin) alpha/beta subunit